MNGIEERVSVVASQEIGDYEARALLDEDRDRVAWHTAREIRSLQADIDRRDRQRKAIISELDWADQRARERIARLEWVMEAIAKAERDDGRKSLRVPGVGTWSTRTVAPGLEIEDADTVMGAIIERGLSDELVKVRESVDTAAVREYVERTGELLPGMARRPERISVSYKLEEGEG